MTAEFLLTEDRGRIRIVTLNRPEKLNALTGAMIDSLTEAVVAADRDDDIYAVLVTGSGRAFCAGRDLTQSTDGRGFTRSERVDDLTSAGRHVYSFRNCSKPVIAAINGIAVGGGLSIALNADIRLMAASAVLRTGYTRRALSPDGGMSYSLPRLLGAIRAAELILSGRDMHSDEARAIGLVAAVYPDDSFREEALSYAQGIGTSGPIGLAYSKKLLVQSLDNSVEAQLRLEVNYLRQCMQTDDVREGAAAFAERRPAVFSGR